MAEETAGWLDSLAKLQPYASKLSSVLSFGGSVYGIYAGIVGDMKDKARWAEVNRKLDEINNKLDGIRGQLTDLDRELQFDKILTQVRLVDIPNWWEDFQRLRALAEDDPIKFQQKWETTHEATTIKWAEKVIDGVPGILLSINSLTKGDVVGIPPLMRAASEKIGAGGEAPGQEKTSLSQYHKAIRFFDSWLALQEMGLVLLGNAYTFLESRKPQSAPIRKVDLIGYASLLARFCSYDAAIVARQSPLTRYLIDRDQKGSQLLALAGMRRIFGEPILASDPLLDLVAEELTKALDDPAIYSAERFPGR